MSCDYDLAAQASLICPECGHRYESFEEMRRDCVEHRAERAETVVVLSLLFRAQALLTATVFAIVLVHWIIGRNEDPARVGVFALPGLGAILQLVLAVGFAGLPALSFSVTLACIMFIDGGPVWTRVQRLARNWPVSAALTLATLGMMLILGHDIIRWVFD